MRNIKDYKILQGSYTSSLEDSVRSHIRKGWQPLGPHTIRYGSSNHSIYYYEQTMVMYDKEQL
jgi:hypothetical protein